MIDGDELKKRNSHYMRLGFKPWEITEFILDDQLWEMAKDLPIDPDNWLDEIDRGLAAAWRVGERKPRMTEQEWKELAKELARDAAKICALPPSVSIEWVLNDKGVRVGWRYVKHQ